MLPSRMFLDGFFDDSNSKFEHMMKCDIYEKDDKTYIEMDMPGVKKEDLTLDLEKGYLTISYESKSTETDEDNRRYIHRERKEIVSSSRRIYVGDVSEEDINAEFKDGILVIKVPNEKKEQPKKTITIN